MKVRESSEFGLRIPKLELAGEPDDLGDYQKALWIIDDVFKSCERMPISYGASSVMYRSLCSCRTIIQSAHDVLRIITFERQLQTLKRARVFYHRSHRSILGLSCDLETFYRWSCVPSALRSRSSPWRLFAQRTRRAAGCHACDTLACEIAMSSTQHIDARQCDV